MSMPGDGSAAMAGSEVTAAGAVPAEPQAVPGPRERGQSNRPSDRFRREERREFRYLLSIVLATVCSWIVSTLPGRLRRWAADQGGVLWHRLAPTYRANVRDNIGQVLGPLATEADLDRMVRRIFKISARNFADLLRLPRTSERELIRTVPLADGLWSALTAARARGQGVILITAHVGAFDFVGQAIAAHRFPLTVVTGRTTARFIFDAVTYLRRSRRMNLVEASPSGVRTMIRALRRGECAVFVGDYDFFQNGYPVEFFGRPTTLPPGPIRIARDTGALVLGVFGQRTETGYEMTTAEPFMVEKTRDLEADVRRGMDRVVAMLERAIAATPDQWVMFQRVWPSAPIDPVRVFPVGSPLESELLKRVDAVLPPRLDVP
jgi:lauroyl/myristoyl acyltransferase